MSIAVGQFSVPVLLVAFNKPDTTKLVFDAIRNVRPQALYVAADGPRSGRIGESDMCDKVRQISTKVDWDCVVHTRFLESNLGCRRAVSSAIDWFFSKVDEGIILEEDCVPTSSFFGFCQELLGRYRDDPRIMHIGGYKPPHVGCDSFAYNFSRYSHIWGWASWRRAWEKYDLDMTILDRPDMNIDDYEIFCKSSTTKRRRRLLEKVQSGLIDTWDYQWNLAIRVNSGLCIRPRVNLISNVGHGHQGATNTKRVRMADPAYEMALPIEAHPPFAMVNRVLDRQHEHSMNRAHMLLERLKAI